MSVYKYRSYKKTYYYFRLYINGKQYSRRFSNGERFSTRKDAEIAESKFLFSIGGLDKKQFLYVYQVYDEFIKFLNDKYKITTAFSLEKSFKKYIFVYLHDYKLNELNDDVFINLNKYINSLDRVDKGSIFSVAKNFIKYLSLHKIIISPGVISKSKNFSLKNGSYNFWTFEEFKKFDSVIENVFYKLLFNVLYFYGLRVGELRGLVKSNFTEQKLIIDKAISNKTRKPGQIVITPKSRSSYRTFPMFDFIYDIYKKLPKNNSEYVFYSMKNSKVIGETTIKRYLKKYCELSGVKIIKIHEFRHSCASLLINKGIDALQVASWLGHSSSIITLQTYSHLFEARKNEVYDFLNKIKNDGY